jgi:hypothetical protein
MQLSLWPYKQQCIQLERKAMYSYLAEFKAIHIFWCFADPDDLAGNKLNIKHAPLHQWLVYQPYNIGSHASIDFLTPQGWWSLERQAPPRDPMTTQKQGQSRCGTIKIPLCLKDLRVKHGPRFYSLLLTMVIISIWVKNSPIGHKTIE